MDKLPVIAGDLLLVRYHHGDLAQEGIAMFQGQSWVHVLCSLGSYQIIEADTGGIRWTDLRDYMIRGDCDIAVMRSPSLTGDGARRAVKYWKSCVHHSDEYSFLGDARLGLILLARDIGLHHLAKHLPDGWLKSSHQKFCSQIGIKGLQKGSGFPLSVDSFNICPGDLSVSPKLDMIAMWSGHTGRWTL